MKMSTAELMIRRLVLMTVGEYEHACGNGYVCINTSDNGRDPHGWWVATDITKEVYAEVRRRRLEPILAT